MKRVLVMGLVILFLCPVMVNAAEPEQTKIAVASNENTSKTSVSNEAAKCPYYLIFNGKGALVEVVDNPYGEARRNAGPSAAHFLARKGITIVIAGNFGSKMIKTLKNKGIAHFECEGEVDAAVKRVLKGGL